MNNDWQQFLRQQGATIGVHAGVPACVAFPDRAGETIIADLSHHGVLAVRGPDAVKFLQGYLTCDVSRLRIAAAEGALCNLQGRMITNFLAIAADDDVLLRMHRSLIEPTRVMLAKYIVFSKAKLTDESDRWQRIGLAGPLAAQLAASLQPPSNASTNAAKTAEPRTITLTAGERYEVWLPPDTAPKTWLHLIASAVPVSAWRWEGFDIAAGRAWVTGQSSGEYLPQMFNLDARGAIDFSKGCYLGQEIVTRAQYRGGVKRRLVRGCFAAEADTPASAVDAHAGHAIESNSCFAPDMPEIAVGAAVHKNGRPIGQLVAVGLTLEREALAVINLAALNDDPTTPPLTVGGTTFTLRNLPYSLAT